VRECSKRLEHDFGFCHELEIARPVRTSRLHCDTEFLSFLVSQWAIKQQMLGGPFRGPALASCIVSKVETVE